MRNTRVRAGQSIYMLIIPYLLRRVAKTGMMPTKIALNMSWRGDCADIISIWQRECADTAVFLYVERVYGKPFADVAISERYDRNGCR